MAGEEGSVSIAMEDQLSVVVEDHLTRKRWYHGDLSTEAAVTLLNASKSSHCFGVYKSGEENYMLSAKYKIEADELVDHLEIQRKESGKFVVSGQSGSHEDIIHAVEAFVMTFEPPLLPALDGSSFESQISISDDPPDYDSANRVLKPDIAPLPDITAIRVDSVKEAKTGRISPSGSFTAPSRQFGNRQRHTPARQLSQWRHYQYLNRCHPKNVCHGCCYRKMVWNGYRYTHEHKWYDCRGSGPLRVLGLLLFWIFCGLCFGCAKGCAFLCTVCCYVCCGFYDSS